jgi:hypothetical protein
MTKIRNVLKLKNSNFIQNSKLKIQNLFLRLLRAESSALAMTLLLSFELKF